MAVIRMVEEWRDITVTDKSYEVSNLGNVRNKRTGKILTPRPTKNGYLRVHLSVPEGGRKDFYIHRLVAEAFCYHPPGCDIINHLDNNPANNMASNLEWCTQKENLEYCEKQHRKARPAIAVIGTKDGIEYYFNSLTEAQNATGCFLSNISMCCKFPSRTIHGYKWRYAV